MSNVLPSGVVYDVAEGGAAGRLVALVVLDGEDVARAVEFWPELVDQWDAGKLRRFLLVEAGRQRAGELAAAAAAAARLEQSRDAHGAGTADPAEFEPTEADAKDG